MIIPEAKDFVGSRYELHSVYTSVHYCRSIYV